MQRLTFRLESAKEKTIKRDKNDLKIKNKQTEL